MNDIDFVQSILLTDMDGKPAKIVKVFDGQNGLDHFEIYTQSEEQKGWGLLTKVRIYFEEVEEDENTSN